MGMAQGIKHGCITTVHNVTNTQTLVDACNSKKSDLRRARAGLMSLAPTSTGKEQRGSNALELHKYDSNGKTCNG